MEPALTEYNCRVEHFSGKGGAMLSKPDFLEATRRYKNKKLNGHERQRYHALLLVTKGYSYRETADILFVDEETISRWTQSYQEKVSFAKTRFICAFNTSLVFLPIKNFENKI